MDVQNYSSQISQLINLLNCALSDGKFVESEKKFLIEIANRFGMDSNFIENIFHSEIEFNFEMPSAKEEKMQHLIDLVFMMMIDCKITNEEKSFCEEIAIRLGFSAKTIDFLISKILKDIKVKVEEDNFIFDKILKY